MIMIEIVAGTRYFESDGFCNDANTQPDPGRLANPQFNLWYIFLLVQLSSMP